MDYTTKGHRIGQLALGLALACAARSAMGAGDTQLPAGLPERAPNFRLTDLDGRAHELFDLRDAKAVVLFVQMLGCPIVRQSYPYLEEMRSKYGPQGVSFLYINSNPWETPESIAAECKEYSVMAPVVRDPHRALAHALGFRRSAETIVIDPKNWKIVYRGMADDRFDYGLQRMSPGKFWLHDTLEAMVSGKTPAISPTIAKGCLLDLDFTVKPDFGKGVAPVLAAKFPTQFGGHPDENTARMAAQTAISALLTGRTAGREIAFADAEAETLVAWLFSSSAAETLAP